MAIEFTSPPTWGIFRELVGFLEYPKNLWGWGDPVADGEKNPVLLVPGYRSGNSSMHMIQKFLAHNRFQAIHWTKDYNNGNVEVDTTHLGIIWNPDVMKTIAIRLGKNLIC